MAGTALVVFCVLFATESLVICLGNAFTIFVFWNQRSGSLKRTSYLLLNLAAIDLSVGIAEPMLLATRVIPFFVSKPSSFDTVHSNVDGYLLSTFLVTFSCMSVISLAVISLERASAILHPFLHRTASVKAYIHSIAFIWASGIGVVVVYVLPAFQAWDEVYSTIAMNSVVFLCLFIICATYIKIRSHLKRSPRIFDCNQRRNMERSIKLSKTLFIVIALSFACWFPAVIVYTVMSSQRRNVDRNCCTYGELCCSAAGELIAYSCRMPSFRKTLNQLLKKQQAENVELAQL